MKNASSMVSKGESRDLTREPSLEVSTKSILIPLAMFPDRGWNNDLFQLTVLITSARIYVN